MDPSKKDEGKSKKISLDDESDGKKQRRSRNSSDGDKGRGKGNSVLIPDKHATVTKSHRIIHGGSLTPSPPDGEPRHSHRGQRLTWEDGHPRKISKPGKHKESDPRRKKTSHKDNTVKEAFHVFRNKLQTFAKKNTTSQGKEEQEHDKVKDEFLETHVISPMWAPEYHRHRSKHAGQDAAMHVAKKSVAVLMGSKSKLVPPDGAATKTVRHVAVGPDGDHKESAASTRSGYVSLHGFADLVVTMDASEMAVNAQKWMKALYCYWVLLVLFACVLSAISVFCFHFMAPVIGRQFLERILLKSDFNRYGVVGVMLSSIAISVWGCLMLTNPEPRRYVYLTVRWIFPLIVVIYIAFCIISHIYECRNLKTNMERAMVKDMKSRTAFDPNVLEQYSQDYLQCCGIYSYKDWSRYGHTQRENRPDLRGGYPTSCCHEDFPLCSHSTPVTLYAPNTLTIQLWQDGCLEKEYALVVIIVSIVVTVECICLFPTIAAIIILRRVVHQTLEFQVEHTHPFL